MIRDSTVKIELTIDELMLIMMCIRNSVLVGKNATLGSGLYDRLDKVIAGM